MVQLFCSLLIKMILTWSVFKLLAVAYNDYLDLSCKTLYNCTVGDQDVLPCGCIVCPLLASLPSLLPHHVRFPPNIQGIYTQVNRLGKVKGNFGQQTYGSTKLLPTDIGCNRYKKCAYQIQMTHYFVQPQYISELELSISAEQMSVKQYVHWTIIDRSTLCPLYRISVEQNICYLKYKDQRTHWSSIKTDVRDVSCLLV